MGVVGVALICPDDVALRPQPSCRYTTQADTVTTTIAKAGTAQRR